MIYCTFVRKFIFLQKNISFYFKFSSFFRHRSRFTNFSCNPSIIRGCQIFLKYSFKYHYISDNINPIDQKVSISCSNIIKSNIIKPNIIKLKTLIVEIFPSFSKKFFNCQLFTVLNEKNPSSNTCNSWF